MKVLLPTTIDFTPTPLESVTFVSYDPKKPLAQEHANAEVLVTWGTPRERLEEARGLSGLRWVQALSAGVNGVVEAFPERVLITSGRGLHDATVAEHALALSLAAARRLHLLRDAQKEGRWADELGGIQYEEENSFRTLHRARVLVWGFGSMAQHLAPLLEALGAEVAGIARSAGERSGFTVHAQEDIVQLLPTTDLLLMMLPSTPETRKILGADKFVALPPHAWLVNVGRGDTVDEAALIAALDKGELAGAALDVFEEEPLPEDSPLWSLENVIITPHAAGGRPRGAKELLERNLKLFLAGEELENLVDRERGY